MGVAESGEWAASAAPLVRVWLGGSADVPKVVCGHLKTADANVCIVDTVLMPR
ncbi:hypothetical protein [Streptomyces erythrochromogenes]|uniref:hypothetical protein n=1 Tax=Streptomyces erythrochromogenes TaxID=285574 RepID=UPI0036FAF5CA